MERVLSGMRPTGRLHLGNYWGALWNWKEIQEKYQCFFFAADWHALTTDFASTQLIKENIKEMVVDWLSAGIDPLRSTLFVQSHIPEHAELFLLLSMVTPLPWLERNPTYKEVQQELKDRDINTFGFLGYPVLMASDILIYKAHRVPVGVDQMPHLELAREIARRFNNLYGQVFPEPQILLTDVPKLLGIDGRKMSKSYNNTILLSEPPEELRRKVMVMVTDPQRARRTDPGRPEVCNVFSYHKLYSPPSDVEMVDRECRRAGIGCVDCKKLMLGHLQEALAPFQERRRHYLDYPEEVDEVIEEGDKRARAVARETLEEAKEAMKI